MKYGGWLGVIHDQQDKCRDYFTQYGGGPQPRMGTTILNSPALYRKDFLCPINHLPAPSRYHIGAAKALQTSPAIPPPLPNMTEGQAKDNEARYKDE